MSRNEYRRSVARLFATIGHGARRTRVAVEQELLAADSETGAAVPIERVRAATAGADYATYLGFEPGGQVELSLPHPADAATLLSRLRRDLAAVRADCARAGVLLIASPVDPRPESEVPLQLCAPRYLAMQRHFDSIGPAGRRMMRRTASTQVCLDWWPGAAGLEQWRLLNLAGPFLAAAFARPGSDRLATWLEVDPSRTAFDDRLLAGDYPVAAYAEFAAGATVFLPDADRDQHLTTLFPPVRPRGGYLEVRFPDVQEDDAIGGLVTAFATLLYDDECRAAALRRVAGEQARLAEHWAAAAANDPGTIARGWELLELSGVVTLEGAA